MSAPDPEDDPAAAFCRAQWEPLARSLALYTGDAGLGEDLAQEALARVLARWPRVSEMASPGGYAYRIGVNLARDALRRRGRARPAGAAPGGGADAPAAALAAPVADAGDGAQRLDVAAAVRALPPRQRLAVALRYLADLPIAEAAAVMGCRPGTVKALCHQATRALRSSPHLSWHDGAVAPRPAQAQRLRSPRPTTEEDDRA